jgi:homogentisate 1,2-dioxygenase
VRITIATVGRIEVKPGAINVIPGEVMFTVDSAFVFVWAITRAVGRRVSAAYAARVGREARVPV